MDDLTRDHFDTHAAYWHDVYFDANTFTGYSLRCVHDAVLERIAARSNISRILDIGCGAGITAAELATGGYKVTACDIAPGMVERAQSTTRERDTTVNLCVARAEALPYPPESFDAVIALGLLSNVRDDAAALREMYRVLRPGGLLLATVANLIALDVWSALPGSLPILLNTTPLRRPTRQAGNVIRRLTGRDPKDPDAIRFGRSVIPPLYARRLRQFNFVNVELSAHSFGPLIPFGVIRLPQAQSIAISRTLQRIKTTPSLATAVLFNAVRG